MKTRQQLPVLLSISGTPPICTGDVSFVLRTFVQVIRVSFSLLAENTVVCRVSPVTMFYTLFRSDVQSHTYRGGLKRIACDAFGEASVTLGQEQEQSRISFVNVIISVLHAFLFSLSDPYDSNQTHAFCFDLMCSLTHIEGD